MKITLINPTPPGLSSFGVRSLSSFLKRQGHDVSLVLLPGSIGLLKEEGTFSYRYDQDVINQLIMLCKGSDLIGLSFFTNYLDRAIQITDALKASIDVPIIWGGIHASTKPEDALQHADIVCLGEGEESILELVCRIKSGQNYQDISGLWFKDKGNIVKNPLRPLIRDLNTLPFFDYSLENEFVLNNTTRKFEPLTVDSLKDHLPLMPGTDGTLKRVFRILTDRGCPHKCTYCNIPTLKSMYHEDKTPFLRYRSVENVIEELDRVIKRFDYIEAIQIFDDTFFARPLDYLERFAETYKRRIGLPFYCQASPTTLTRAKLDCLAKGGLIYVEMGIQTGSVRIRKMYNRSESNAKILEATNLLHEYRDKLLPPDYHIITDNPWETQEDILETAKLLHQIPKPYGLAISSLVFFPKTELYEKASAEGMINDELKEISLKPFYIPPKGRYLNFLIYLHTFEHFPKWIMKLLLTDFTVKRLAHRDLKKILTACYRFGELLRFVVKGFKTIIKRDWTRIDIFFKKLKANDPVVAGRKGK